MNKKIFEESLSNINDKYVTEAMDFKKKNHTAVIAFAASFVLLVASVLSIFLFDGKNDLPITSSNGEIIDIGSPTQSGNKEERPEYIFANGNLYLCVAKSNDNVIDDTFNFIGKITSFVGENEIPSEHLQSSGEWVGCEIYENKTILFVITQNGTYAYQINEN